MSGCQQLSHFGYAETELPSAKWAQSAETDPMWYNAASSGCSPQTVAQSNQSSVLWSCILPQSAETDPMWYNAASLGCSPQTVAQSYQSSVLWSCILPQSAETDPMWYNAASLGCSPQTVAQSNQSSVLWPCILPRIRCTCPNCQRGVNSKRNTNGASKKKQHNCHYAGCSKTYTKTSNLRAHLRCHSGERPFFCTWPYCREQFTSLEVLQRHIRTHTGEKPYACTECGTRFMRKDYLNKHIKTIHQPK